MKDGYLRNKIYIYDLSEGIVDKSFAEEHYDILFLKGKVEEFSLTTSQGIIFFDPDFKYQGKDFRYYREILLIDRQILQDIIEPDKS